ncbi:MAG: Nif3-like dinuclear metal center hexameric protein [Tissierellia bacterium]|nr:Nif3-like dinuclear metal center hexameric protein [Tissierellia bacterium]
MQLREIIKKLEIKYPLNSQQSWDNSGLQIGCLDATITKAYVALDVEIEHVNRAIDEGAELLITHHPLFFDSIKSLEKNCFYYELIKMAMTHDINIVSFHTNFDSSPEGMIYTPFDDFWRGGKERFVEEEGQFFGFKTMVDPIALRDFAKQIGNRVATSSPLDIRVYGNPDKIVKSIAFMGGSGGGYVAEAIAMGCDLYITGDVKYHQQQAAQRDGMAVMDLGHGGSEVHFVDIMKTNLEEMGLSVIGSHSFFGSSIHGQCID